MAMARLSIATTMKPTRAGQSIRLNHNPTGPATSVWASVTVIPVTAEPSHQTATTNGPMVPSATSPIWNEARRISSRARASRSKLAPIRRVVGTEDRPGRSPEGLMEARQA